MLTKRDLIGYVEEIANTTMIKNVLSDRPGGRFTIYVKEFQRIGILLKAEAEFYEEAKFLIEAKICKGHGWDELIRKDLFNCGEVFLEYMEKIKGAMGDSSDKDIIDNISLFFGYMYWKATVIENKNHISQMKRRKEGEYITASKI